MKSLTKCLFGGALVTAGMAAGAARAQQFTFTNSSAYVYAIEYQYSTSATNTFAGPGPFDCPVSIFGDQAHYASADVRAAPTGLHADAGALGGYAIYTESVTFMLDQNATASVVWDFTAGSGRFDMYDANGLFFSDGGNATGSVQIPFAAGASYLVQGYGIAQTVGTSHFDITIPAPASGGPLALAGLGAARRRRTMPPRR